MIDWGKAEPEWLEYSTGMFWRDEEQAYGEYRAFLAGLDYRVVSSD